MLCKSSSLWRVNVTIWSLEMSMMMWYYKSFLGSNMPFKAQIMKSTLGFYFESINMIKHQNILFTYFLIFFAYSFFFHVLLYFFYLNNQISMRKMGCLHLVSVTYLWKITKKIDFALIMQELRIIVYKPLENFQISGLVSFNMGEESCE